MATQPTDGTKINYRIFHPQTTVWVQNPFDHDVIFQVADESDNPFQYKLGAHKVSELPGGAVATLGVKAIVDELIQNGKDVLSIWDATIRTKYEEDVILRVKEASTATATRGPIGEIDLSVKNDDVVDEPDIPLAHEDIQFPELQNDPAAAGISDIANASLGAGNTVIEEK